MAEYSKIAGGYFYYGSGSSGVEKVINLPFYPQSIQIWNNNIMANPVSGANFYTEWDPSWGQGNCLNGLYTSALAWSNAASFGGGVTVFNASSGVIFGSPQQIVSIPAANVPAITVTNHGYSVGDVVVFEGLYQTSNTGMIQICGIPFVITAATMNTFNILWNCSLSNYTALSGSPAGAVVKKIINPDQYFPGISFINNITLGTTTSVEITTIPNVVVGQTVSFRIPPQWGTTQLNSGQNPNIPGFAIYGSVLSISNNNININVDSTNFTAFNTNIPFAATPGLSFPQVVGVGDNNTGGGQPVNNGIPSVNGPSISGAFVNNTKYGFIMGPKTLLQSATTGNTIRWEATAYDYYQVLGSY